MKLSKGKLEILIYSGANPGGAIPP